MRLPAAHELRALGERAVLVGHPGHDDHQVQLRLVARAPRRTAGRRRPTTCTGPRGRPAGARGGWPSSSPRATDRSPSRRERVRRADRPGRCAASGPRGARTAAGSGSCGAAGPRVSAGRARAGPGSSAMRVVGVGVGRGRPTARGTPCRAPPPPARAAAAARRATAAGRRTPADIGWRLRVALVRGVVAPAVAQVDAAGEGDVPGRVVGMPQRRRTSGGGSRRGAPAGRAAPRRRPSRSPGPARGSRPC